MPTELHVQAVHRDGMHFVTTAGEHTVSLDYPVRPGSAGPSPFRILAE
jgi:hypothetical protein